MFYASTPPQAAAHVSGGRENPGLQGTVSFFDDYGYTVVVAEIYGLPESAKACAPGFFGFHVHEGGACTGAGFSDTGPHYAADSCGHPAHAGDLPPLLSCGGMAYLAVRTDRFCVPEVIGRTVVIHAMPDDFTTQPAGNSGEKIACGVIEAVCP